MPIKKSSFTLGTALPSGLIPVTERHETTANGTIVSKYSAPAGYDHAMRMAETAANVKAELADREFAYAPASDKKLALAEQTSTQFLARFKTLYRKTNSAQAAMMAWWLLRRIADASFTESSVKTALGGTTDLKWKSIKARLDQQSRAWAAFIKELGEEY